MRMTIHVCLTEPQKGVRLNRERLEISRVGPEGSRVGPDCIAGIEKNPEKDCKHGGKLDGLEGLGRLEGLEGLGRKGAGGFESWEGVGREGASQIY